MYHWAYEDVLAFAKSWSVVYFSLMFLAAFAYAYWPKSLSGNITRDCKVFGA